MRTATRAETTDPALYLLRPGRQTAVGVYGEFRGPIALDELPAYLPAGGIVAVRPHPSGDWSDFSVPIDQLQRRLVNAPVALWPDLIGHERAVEFAGKARQLGVRSVVWNRHPDREQIRAQLADPADWPFMVVLWLRHRAIVREPDVGVLFAELAEGILDHADLKSHAAFRGVKSWRWSRRFRRAGLAPAGLWYAALRLTRIGLEIQREPEESIESIALRVGYSTLSALSRRFYTGAGARPTFVRDHLGWQWLLAASLRRSGIRLTAGARNRPPAG